MRTTLTLDDDLAEKLRAETRRTGKPFKDIVNDCLRSGLHRRREKGTRAPFRIEARSLGALRPGLSLDNIGDLLDRIEGPLHR